MGTMIGKQAHGAIGIFDASSEYIPVGAEACEWTGSDCAWPVCLRGGGLCFSAWCQPAWSKFPTGPRCLWPSLCPEHCRILQAWYVLSSSPQAIVGDCVVFIAGNLHSDHRGNLFFPIETDCVVLIVKKVRDLGHFFFLKT